MTWRHPETGERRLDRGAEWFLIRDGKIAEVRAYHHGGPKNPQGDLLGFDHEGRGYTMLEELGDAGGVGGCGLGLEVVVHLLDHDRPVADRRRDPLRPSRGGRRRRRRRD